MALRKKPSDSAAAHSMISKTGEDQDAFYSHDQGHAAENGQNSDTYLTPTHRGKMPEGRGNHNAFSSEDQGNTADIDQGNETPTSSEGLVLNHKTTGFPKADLVLGYGEEDKIPPKKVMTELATSPEVSHEKKSLRKLFYRKGSKESTTSPSSSGKTVSRMKISAPTLVDASPDAKNVVNYSRPIAHHSSSDISNGSPIVRGRSSSASHGLNPFLGPSTSPGGHTDKSGDISKVSKALICNCPTLINCRSMTIPTPQLHAVTKLLMSIVLLPRP